MLFNGLKHHNALGLPVTSDHAKMLIKHLEERCFELSTQELKKQQMSLDHAGKIMDLDPDSVDYEVKQTTLLKKYERKSKSIKLIRQNRWLLLLHRHKQELEESGFPLTPALESLPALQTHCILFSW